jgi:hypothetical protein
MSCDSTGAGIPGDAEAVRRRIHTARAEGTLGGLFEILVAEHGRGEASRLWLAAFAESDASET